MMQNKKFFVLAVLVLVIKQSSPSPIAPKDEDNQKVDLNVDLSCIANSSCVKNFSTKVVRALNMKKVIDFGAFTVEPVKNAKKEVEGRSMSKIGELINSNSLRVPLGSYSLSLQKSEQYDNYFEVSFSKIVEGRGRREKKHLQLFVPAFLVASQVGWWILAISAVSLLSIKAFLVSKLALVIGAAMTLKKLFEHPHQGVPPHYYEHHEPMMVPYNFDLSGFSGPSGFPGDFNPSLPLGGEHTAALHQNGALGAETNNVITNITGVPSIANAPGLSAYATVARHPPLNFNYLGKNPFLYRKP